ncbi:Uncharacterised protein [Vibrio cholerae]|nr:Uncharacterised protein [Vibrio cholerae]CSB66021.1 Uncharacterised protein [Vibrio cholerae]
MAYDVIQNLFNQGLQLTDLAEKIGFIDGECVDNGLQLFSAGLKA